MAKTTEAILLEISQLQARLDEAEQLLLRMIGPQLAAALPVPHREYSLNQLARSNQALERKVARHHHAEQELLEANQAQRACEQHYRRMVEAAGEGIWILNDCNETAFVNRKMAAMLGYSAEEMLGKSIVAFTDPGDAMDIRQALLRRQDTPQTYDMRFIRRDGRDLWAIVCTTPIVDQDGRYAGTLEMIADITERKHLERRAADIARWEQERISRDLHDVLGQTLAAIALLSKILQQQLQREGRPEADDVGRIADLVGQGMKQARFLAQGLQAVPAEPDGLRKALGEYASDVENMYGVFCRFECDPAIRLANHDLASHLYHIAQEAVSNAVKHGQATEIRISLARSPLGRLDLEIANDGADFPEQTAQPGLGLRILNQRADAIGAALRIRRGPAGGTLVTCSVPGSLAEAEVQSRYGNSTGSDQ